MIDMTLEMKEGIFHIISSLLLLLIASGILCVMEGRYIFYSVADAVSTRSFRSFIVKYRGMVKSFTIRHFGNLNHEFFIMVKDN